MKRPDLPELIGEDAPAEELERLRRVHELLLAAGPPPELPPALAEAPATGVRASLLLLPRRRRGAVLLLAAAFLAVAFGGGFLAGYFSGGEEGFRVSFEVPMRGTAGAPRALASLQVGAQDKGGNWPLLLVVRGLRPLPEGGYYELYLTKKGKAAASCGTFTVVSTGTTKVSLNAPYKLLQFDGWIVTARVPGRPDSDRPLMTT